MSTTLESMKIIGEFVLAKDVTEEFNNSTNGLLLVNPEDNRMSADNLHIFEVVKTPEIHSNYIQLEVGDRIISISTGNDLCIDGINYKMFELKYIVGKINGK